jgi:predicted component of type VI protein secretion system
VADNLFKTKGVTFNLGDPDQYELYKHSKKRKNFSAYVKRLIQRDLEESLRSKGIKLNLS